MQIYRRCRSSRSASKNQISSHPLIGSNARTDCSFWPVLAQIIAAGQGLLTIKFDDDLVPDDSTRADGFSFTQTKNSSGETWTRFF